MAHRRLGGGRRRAELQRQVVFYNRTVGTLLVSAKAPWRLSWLDTGLLPSTNPSPLVQAPIIFLKDNLLLLLLLYPRLYSLHYYPIQYLVYYVLRSYSCYTSFTTTRINIPFNHNFIVNSFVSYICNYNMH